MSAVIKAEPSALVPAASSTLGALLGAAERGASPEVIEKLMVLHERHEANEARRAFSAAMAAFRAERMRVTKSKDVAIPGGARFKHATLTGVVEAVTENLSRHGLRHAWEITQDNKTVTVTCVITHAQGHSERVSMSAPADDSGRKNPVQQIASTVTYLERYTLLAATGLAPSDDEDDDGNGHAEPEAVKEPAGLESWMADARAVADEGSERLRAFWKAAGNEMRVFVGTHRASWWIEVKAHAAQVKS